MTNGKQGTLIQRIEIQKEAPGTRFEVKLNAFINPAIIEIMNPHPLKIQVKLTFRRNEDSEPEDVVFSIHPPVIERLGKLPLNLEGVKGPGPPLIVSVICRI